MRHPKGLYLLFATEMAERFSYYGMRSIFTLYLIAALFSKEYSSQIYGSFTGLVYLTPLLGGYVADKYWGNRRSIIFGGIIMAIGQFFLAGSAAVVKQSIFTSPLSGGAVDPNVDNSLSIILMFTGLAFLIFGNGFFKPNISTMVGDLYEPTDHRKDSAFTIFYMGINVGAFIAPFICGTLGNGDWSNPSAFKWGFFCAGCAMILSIIIFVLLKDKYLVTPDGKEIGYAPSKDEVHHLHNAEAEDEAIEQAKNSPLRLIFCAALAVILFYLFARNPTSFNDYISAAVYALGISVPVFIITDKTLTKDEMSRIGVIYIIAIFVIFFWSAFEQAGTALTYFAEEQTDRTIGSWTMPTSWFQSINPIFVVVFAPVFAKMWEALNKRGMEPASPMKQAIGVALLAISYLMITIVTSRLAGPTDKINMFWLIALYGIMTFGELSLSPIGLSMVNKLSPARLASLLMGVWFMSNAISNILAGYFATLYPEPGKPAKVICGFEVSTISDFFLLFVVMAGVSAILLFSLCPLIKKMMRGVE